MTTGFEETDELHKPVGFPNGAQDIFLVGLGGAISRFLNDGTTSREERWLIELL